jgi:tripartite-type tricarboxylate transporter receptor subunit TctC
MQETPYDRPNTCDVRGRRAALRVIGAASLAPMVGANLAQAQSLPDTVRIVAGVPAGNPVEAPARALAEALNATSGRTYIIDNRTGAGGMRAAREVAVAKPDGSHLLWVNASHTISPLVYKRMPYDPIADFSPVTKLMTASGFSLLVRANSPYRTVTQLIKAAQDQPGRITYASLGLGNALHLLTEAFGHAIKARFLHVPYSASPIPDLLGGHVEFMFLGNSISVQMIESKQVRVLAVTSDQRFSVAPDAPTFAEMGIKDVDIPAWGGFIGPRGMSPELALRFQQEIARAVKHKIFLDYVKSSGDMTVVVDTPPVFGAYLTSEIERLRKLFAPLGIALDSGFS